MPDNPAPYFILRLLWTEDASALFSVYHDEAAVSRMNADNCDFGFYADTPEKMADTIAHWLKHCGWRFIGEFRTYRDDYRIDLP